jgi:hypothetical protein
MLYNINPKKWGDAYWKMSHYITFAYPDAPTNEDKINVKSYFDNLRYLLPCANCRGHYIQHLSMYPLTDDILSSRYKLIKWLIDLHNAVNRRIGQREYTIDEVFKMYSGDNNSYFNIDQNILQIIFLVVIIVALIVYMKNK